jgi:hypothetical protein
MNDHGKSDRPVLPAKPSNKAAQAAAETVEERGLPEGNTASKTRSGHSAGQGVSSALDRVRRAAQKDKDVRFTALLHHVDLDRLRAAYRALSPRAAAGVDGVTWQSYGQDLEGNLQDLHARLHRGAYRARPSRRAYIPKADGRLRPLGIAALEDKIVQRAVVEVLNAVYEVDFLGFSYGFRPGRGQHDALDALAAGILTRKVNWVIDADIRDCFTGLDQSCREAASACSKVDFPTARGPWSTTTGSSSKRRRTTSPSRRSTISERIAGMTTAYSYFRDPRLLYSAIRALYDPRSEHLLYRTRCSPPKVPEQVKIERRGSRLNLSHPRAGARAPNTRCPTKRTWRHRHVLNLPGTTGNHGYRRAARPTCDLPICRAFPSLPGMSARP